MGPTVGEEEIRKQTQADGVTHIATGVAVERGGKLLIVRRAADDSRPGAYELPGGGVGAGETVADGAIRELREEVGLTTTKILVTFPGFDYTTSSKKLARQINFLVEASGDVQLSHEHDRYLWITPGEIADLAASDEMKKCFTQAFAALRDYQLSAAH